MNNKKEYNKPEIKSIGNFIQIIQGGNSKPGDAGTLKQTTANN